MQLLIDLHCHSRFSADGVAEPEALVSEARAKGLHGFAITDHNTCACVDYFEQHGFLNRQGLPVDGLLIIPGQEITTAEGHLLALGVRLPDLKGIPAIEAVELIHKAGGLAIPPHPYDFFRAGIREPVLETLNIDALEVFNAATTLKRYNRQAFTYAQERGLPMTAASDAHDSAALGTAYSILEANTFSLAGVLEAIRKGPALRQRYLTPAGALKKTWNNVFRLRRKRRPQTEKVT
ncbi:MAG TPA: CehA/McbA family metallohydrolase [Candidatus Methylacidiphilales bacterium]|nr:CehA/McbA family metallohydrolase [Candidatus Methylacidiphilales bacterium]